MRIASKAAIRFSVQSCLVLHFVLVVEIAYSADDPIASKAKTLLARKCLSCHSGDGVKGKLDLTTREAILKGGETGPAIIAKSLETSLVWQRVQRDEMPPKHPLSADEKRLLKDWISAGAVWDGGPLDPLAITSEHRAGLDWWSLQPLSPVQIPMSKSLAVRRLPVDDFVLAKLESQNLTMSTESERRVIIRRVSFDLLGLPPSLEDIDFFVHDERPDAFERLVDKFLASPHYGERWARHWLDVVRFGESNGFERDLPRPNAWPYRDWVINALNCDMPYDQFVRWQLAGDLLVPEDLEAVKAVGFIVAGAHDTVVPVVDKMRAMMRQDELEDIVATVSQTFLGLTVNCARCHDHKFDPITTREYYQLASALAGIDHGEREFVRASTNGPLEELRQKPAESEKIATLKIYTAIATQSPPMKIHKRGSVTSLGDEVEPAGLAAVQGLSPRYGLRPDAIESHRRLKLANWITDARNPLFARVMINRVWHYHFGSGLVETPNDLGFHAGLPSHPELLEWLAFEFAATSENKFSTETGTPQPSVTVQSSRHSPNAVAPMEPVTPSMSVTAFSLKRLHRLLITSATYRQSSTFNPIASKWDASNRLIWRMNPHRLEAEAVRDAILAVAGQLNTEIGGKGYTDTNSYFFKGTQFYDPIDPVGYKNHRRTLYRMWARGGRSPFLDTFDCPDPSTTTPRRSATVTPLQALSLLNNSFSLRMAEDFANRLTEEAGPVINSQVQLAYRLLFGREPEAVELALSHQFISKRGLSEFCRAMWNSSEFLFID